MVIINAYNDGDNSIPYRGTSNGNGMELEF